MGWTTPVDQATGHLITAVEWNTQVIDNISYLHGDAGSVNLSAGNATYTIRALLLPGSIAGNPALQMQVSGDANPRAQFSAGGVLSFGDGTNSVDTIMGRTSAGVANINGKLTEGGSSSSGAIPGTWTPALANGLFQKFTITSGGAATLTIGATAVTPAASQSSLLFLVIQNNGGGTATLTWNAQYVGSTVALPTSMASGAQVRNTFIWDVSLTKWLLLASV